MSDRTGKAPQPSLRAAVSPGLLDEIVRRLVAAASLRGIIVFGSYIYGQPGPGDDLDVMVLYQDGGPDSADLAQRAYAARRGIRLPVELRLRPVDQSGRWATVPASFEWEVREKGRVVYGAEG